MSTYANTFTHTHTHTQSPTTALNTTKPENELRTAKHAYKQETGNIVTTSVNL